MMLTYRLAKSEDMELLFNWANDDLVRSNSFSPDRISKADHQKWFIKKVNAKDSFIFIFYHGEASIGQLRLEITDNNLLDIDFSVSSAYRGQGFGKEILINACSIVKKLFPTYTLRGVVHNSNKASITAFESAGFIKTGEEVMCDISCSIYLIQ